MVPKMVGGVIALYLKFCLKLTHSYKNAEYIVCSPNLKTMKHSCKVILYSMFHIIVLKTVIEHELHSLFALAELLVINNINSMRIIGSRPLQNYGFSLLSVL